MVSPSNEPASATRLSHQQVQQVILSLGEAGLVNLDASIRSFIEPVGQALARGETTVNPNLHVVCCNEYAVVTG